ncbi:MAG TPA: replicative DNA helicase [Dehalococcoidia bacterium]|nr:replicative DNA helicase [Dehalococcoidia bacterium]
MYGESGESQSDIKLPPHDLDAEEAVLGSILIDPEAIVKVNAFLNPNDFYREKNRWTYDSCVQLFDRKEAINQITVAHELARQHKLEAAGGAEYLSHLVSQVPTSVHVEYYANIVRRLSMMRRLISASNQIAAIGYEAPPDIDDALGRAEGILYGLRSGQTRGDFVHIRDVLDRYFEESGIEEQGFIPHIPTGFPDLDRILIGMQRSDMVVLASRPSLGKTSLALNIARNAAVESKASVALFSLEMSKMELAYRFLAFESGIDAQKVRLDELSESQRETISETMGYLSEVPIYIDDSPFLKDSDMRSKAIRLKQDKGIDLIIVDYIQLLRSSRYMDSRTYNRVQEMSEISHSIKELARELEVPILAVSQMSRAIADRHPPIPQLSDLRDSGSIEQDADVVLFIYREDLTVKDEEEWERKYPGKPFRKGIAEIIVAKHRNGPIGRAHLFFRDRIAKFENLEETTELERHSLL